MREAYDSGGEKSTFQINLEVPSRRYCVSSRIKKLKAIVSAVKNGRREMAGKRQENESMARNFNKQKMHDMLYMTWLIAWHQTSAINSLHHRL